MSAKERDEFNEMAGYNSLPKLARPLPQELKEALSEFQRAANPQGYGLDLAAARAALVAIYERQREEIEKLQKRAAHWREEKATTLALHNDNLRAEVASLSSQVERQREEIERANEGWDNAVEALTDSSRILETNAQLRASVERLKAEQLTAEEAKGIRKAVSESGEN